VARAFAHLHWFRRLRIRWEIRDDIHEAFLSSQPRLRHHPLAAAEAAPAALTVVVLMP
jgi:hypothetical protein